MASDLEIKKGGESDPKKASVQILREEIREGLNVFARSPSQLFYSGVSAGLDVGFSLFLMGVMRTLAQNHFSEAVTRILVAAMYSFGFIFVVLGRSELFTEQTTLAVLPVLNGDEKISSLGRLWGIVLLSNLIGAAIFAALIVVIAPALGVVDPDIFGDIAHRMVNHTGVVIFGSAVLAGWLMGLLSWLVTASRDTISQIVLVGLITWAIGIAGLHHVVAGAVEVLGGVFIGRGANMADFGKFLIWATLGNIVGGTVFVALIKYGHAHKVKKGA
jgi:formate/nitrite transporter FocA (FNT family)